MLASLLNFVQGAVEMSTIGCVELASVVLIVYYIYAKTRTLEILTNLFPNLKLNINYRPSIVKFNTMGNELLTTLRRNVQPETKQTNALTHAQGTNNMLQLTPHAGKKPYQSMFDWGVYFPFLAQCLRIKRFEYPQVSGAAQEDLMIQRAIKQAAEQIVREQRIESHKTYNLIGDTSNDTEESKKYQDILSNQERRANNILMNMRSTLNHYLIMLTSWLLYKLLPCFLSGVVTHTRQIETLKKASERAPGIPLIFLPLHRSHLDYIMVTFILTNNDIRSPLVAAGDNLQIPVFGGLLRGLGAFFIKRKIDPVVGKKDILYRAILQQYIQHALKMSHNVEFFIEGGRTRTGKPCMPKGGILSVIVNAFMDHSIPDALLVPVSVNYERLVDGNFVREQKGEKKVPESFWKAMAGIWKTLHSKYGLMRIDFNEPYSIKELVQSYNKVATDVSQFKVYKPSERKLQHNQSTSSLYGTDVVCEEHRTLIDSISREVVYDCATATSVMSTNALAFLMLTQFRKGALATDIALALDSLRNRLKGRKDMAFAGDSLHIVNYSADLLGEGLIMRTQDERGQTHLQPVQSIEASIELSYYSNMLTPHFALQSVLMITFHELLSLNEKSIKTETETDNIPGISRKNLIDAALANCDVLRYEFILHKPTQILSNLLEINLDELIVNDLIKLPEIREEPDSNAESRKIARSIAAYLEDEDDSEYVDYVPNGDNQDEQPDIFLANDTLTEQKAICEVLAPVSHTYLSVAQSLSILYKNSMLETEFIKFVINSISNKVNSGACPYAESVSTDSVRNCLKLLEKWSVLEISNDHGLRLLTLGTLYETSKESIKTIIGRIAKIVPPKTGYLHLSA
ncbi:glycerol-3-phosphate acyltransferase 1, mitochondrial isoform X1 [Bactrocera dorsalis]|uniref:Glycerol-3-phosphate acyltransferase 1, mitochondrial isoform X1 n=1 Tax=Bactrocera dorsalis TaxID=27457 RepID=A0A6I9UMX2_BACDO|nr:glycerol-3-phosphate acyltransferase 1, mitochondrial isoform X1 [Bactrocera dorsalis]